MDADHPENGVLFARRFTDDQRTLDRRPIAHVRFVDGGATPDPLFDHVRARRTTKEAFEPRDVAADDL